jgi:hypothetical protein
MRCTQQRRRRGRHRARRRRRTVARQGGDRQAQRRQCRHPGRHQHRAQGALEAPVRQIAENSGVEGSTVVGKVLENKSPSFGFDAQTEQYVDMLAAGIVDPAKVVRVALQDAASVAGLMITADAMVAETPKKKEALPWPGGDMGGMDY